MRSRVGASLLLLVGLLPTGAWAERPDGPRVVVNPEPGKPPDLFAAEQDFCRSEAEFGVESDTGSGSILRSAVIGTVLGAAAGAVFSGRRHDNTGIGAVAGMVIGAANGASRQSADDEYAQRRYDTAYEQCMLAKGNGTPRAVYRQAAPRYAPPPGPTPTSTHPSGAASSSGVPPDYVEPDDWAPDAPPPGGPQWFPPPPPSRR